MSEHNQPDPSRRRFLGSAAAAIGGLSVAPGVFLYEVAEARPADQAVTDKVRWGILVDTNQCGDGCDDCVKACSTENGWQDTGQTPDVPCWWV